MGKIITIDMINKKDLRITEKMFTLENDVITLALNAPEYDLTGKIITAVFSPSGVETEHLEAVDGIIQIPIYSSMVKKGINFIQLNFRWDTTKLEQSGKLMWVIGQSLETTGPAQKDIDIISYLINEINTAKETADRVVSDAGDVKQALDQSVDNAGTAKDELDSSITTSGTAKSNLEDVIGAANTKKTELVDAIDNANTKINEITNPDDGTIKKANDAKVALEEKITEAGTAKTQIEDAITNNQIVTLPEFNAHKEDVEQQINDVDAAVVAHKEEYTQLNIGNRLTNLEEASIKKYGVRRVLGATTPVLERLGDAVGKVANADTDLTKHNVVQNDFDKIFPWSHIRNCIITASGRIIYQGEAGYSEAIGDWMVEIPEFYWKRTNDGIHLEEWVSPYPVGGYAKSEKFYIARFKTSEQDDAHVSKPNSFPKVTLSRAGFRTKAMEKGAGWQLEDLLGNYILNLLYRVEFAHLNSQLILGSGVTSVRYTEDDLVQVAEDNTNRVVLLTANANNYNVGEAISIGTSRGNMAGGQYRTILAINDLGNGTKELVFDGTPINVLSTYKVYMAGQVSGKTLGLLSSSGTAIGINNRSSITYRGIEDVFGNVWEWIDGVLIDDHRGYVCLAPAKYTDTVTADYKPLSYENAKANNYAGELGFDSNYPFAEFAVDVTGGSATKYCDYYYQNTGLHTPCVGGSFASGVSAGLRFWHLRGSPGLAGLSFGARLLKTP